MMYNPTLTTHFSNAACGSDWAPTLDRIIAQAEAVELDLAGAGSGSAHDNRKVSGSFYTPADVADHVWDQFFRMNHIQDAPGLRAWAGRFRLVEPAAGAGIFVFTFLRKALQMGLSPRDLAAIGFSIIDVNLSALRFVRDKLSEVETSIGVALDKFALVQRDFLEWSTTTSFDRLAFVGNPPFVGNPSGARWRNLYADFLEAMLDYPCKERAVGLILPMSICFSRDYRLLRQRILGSSLGISAASYDNIPDCLFKAGKPESGNTNKANSQRCTILILGGPDDATREAATLRRWSAAERTAVLSSLPTYEDFSSYEFDDQFPRPESREVMAYLAANQHSMRLGDMASFGGSADFAVGAVARNYIGMREVIEGDKSGMTMTSLSKNESLMLLQIVSSHAFYRYWLTVGDGFHVTRGLIDRFPVSEAMMKSCRENIDHAEKVWERRADFSREKLNSGKIVRSFHFSDAFSHVSLAS